MKLNYKRTILVGFTFFLICAFWQAYDTIIPKILTDRFGMSQALSGMIMAIDNVLALFLLPLFGTFSDKCRSKFGKRKPFILIGTIIAVASFLLLSLFDCIQLKHINHVTKIDAIETSKLIYDEVQDIELVTPEGEKFILSSCFSSNDFCNIKSKVKECSISADYFSYVSVEDLNPVTVSFSKYKFHIFTNGDNRFYLRQSNAIDNIEINEVIRVNNIDINLRDMIVQKNSFPDLGISSFSEITNVDYTNYVVPARQTYISLLTDKNPAVLICFIVNLLILLVAMSSFRSPAVALMPDITPKPLRSKANAVINLMGTLGGIIVLVLGMGFLFDNSAIKNTFRPYFLFFLTVSLIMLIALFIYVFSVDENKWSTQIIDEQSEDKIVKNINKIKLSKKEFLSLILILLSVFLWYFGYNAVISKYSVYATNVLDMDYSSTLLIANAAAVISYLPIGFISSKWGRKKVILTGVAFLSLSFLMAGFMRVGSNILFMNIIFVLTGIGWAAINVNSFPMVVELSSGQNIGKYTGIYYAASMSAQAITPFLSGLLMDNFGMTILFPYAAIFSSLSFISMLFVKHGDTKTV